MKPLPILCRFCGKESCVVETDISEAGTTVYASVKRPSVFFPSS